MLSLAAFSQNTWNQQIPFLKSLPFAYHGVSFTDGRILISSGEKIAEFDQFGTCTGYNSLPTNIQISNFVRRRVDPITGELFFFSGLRKISGNTGYSLRIFKPKVGYTASLELPDSLGNPNHLGAAVVALDDSTVVVFGRKYIHKVRAQGSTALTQLWQKPLAFPTNSACIAALAVNNGFIALSPDGGVMGFDGIGQPTFSKTLPYSFFNAAGLSDGIIACGSNSDQKAVLVKLTFDGDIIWSQVYADKQYNHVASTLDGGFVATGTTAANTVALLKTAGNGQQIWSRTYQKGTGTRVVAMPDGGYFFTAIAALPTTFYGIKTDAFGATETSPGQVFVQNRQLKNDGVKATFEPTASLFFNGYAGTLTSPSNGDATTMLTFSPQIGGFDADGQLHLAAEDFSGPNADFRSGLIAGHNGDFNRVWLATETAISSMRRDYLKDQTLNESVPYDLLTWPAKGNRYNEYNIDFTKIKTDRQLQLAPFVDFNQDGMYNVFEGDYPLIKGDKMAWWVMNDDSIHLNSNALPMKFDLAISAYLYDCPQNESVENSIFVDFEFINRSVLLYDSCFLGFFTDFDLGCHLDDYIGSIPATNTFYSYNRDAVDDNCSGIPNFGDEIPIQTVTFQDRALSRFSYFGPSNPAQTNPSAPLEYYNYLQGLWKDGTPLTIGGSGYNLGSTNYTTHAYPANPADPQGWSLCTTNLPYADRRALGSHGPFTFSPGESFKISVAFTTHHGIPLPCPDVFGLVKPAIAQLSGWSNDGTLEAAPNLGVVQEILGNPITLGADIPGAVFQWSTGETSPTIEVNGPGEYTVTVTSSAGCQTVETVMVKLGANIVAPPQKANWSLFPNPAADVIQVSCPDCGQGDALWAVLRNAQGAVVHRHQAAASSFPVPLQRLPAGMYWLELWEGEVYLGSKRFVSLNR